MSKIKYLQNSVWVSQMWTEASLSSGDRDVIL